MSYVIRPREVFGVIAATGREHATLHDSLTRASELVAAAAEADQGAPAVVAELAAFRAEHDRLTELQETRVERADHGARAAIAAYHRGDEEMAEAFTRSSAVPTAVRRPRRNPPAGSPARRRDHCPTSCKAPDQRRSHVTGRPRHRRPEPRSRRYP